MRKIRLPKFKKETIYLFVAGIACVLLLVGTALILNSRSENAAAADVSKINSKRSQVMVTGKGYHAKNGKNSEQEKKRENRERSDKSKAWKKTAPNSKNRKRSESRTGKVIKSDAGKKNGREGKEPSEIPPREAAGTPDNADKNPADDANSGTNKRKNKKNKKQNDGKGNKTKVEESNPKAPILTVKFENVDRVENNTTYIKGTFLSFSLSAVTHKGRKVERFGFNVELNGKKMYSGGDRYVGLYSATIDSGGASKLKTGFNRIVAHVADTNGNETTETYRIVMDSSQEGKKEGTATVSCDLHNIGKEDPIGTLTIPIYEGEKVSHVVKRYFEDNGTENKAKIDNKGTLDYGFYLTKVTKEGIAKDIPAKTREENLPPPYKMRDDNSLQEKDLGKNSGWKYTLNGKTPGDQDEDKDAGMSAKRARDGDEIVIWYTLNL